MINVCEIFKSIQGESTHAGCICTFVRLTGCNLDCSYCDTKYAFTEGTMMSIDKIVAAVSSLGCNLVELTGGEPLLQKEVGELCNRLLQSGHKVLIETNGSMPINIVPKECVKIVDVKCPGSGFGNSFLIENLEYLQKYDEVKFVISDKYDFEWSSEFVKKHKINERATVLFSPCMGRVDVAELVSWIVGTNAPVRLGLQLHKLIWGDRRGV